MFTEPSLIIVMTTINIGNNNIGGAQVNVGYLRIHEYLNTVCLVFVADIAILHYTISFILIYV